MTSSEVEPPRKTIKLDSQPTGDHSDLVTNVSTLDLNTFGVMAASNNFEWAHTAAAVFKEYGFCVVRGVLSKDAAADVLDCCQRVEQELLKGDLSLRGNRDFGRYSMGTAAKTGALLHHAAWRHLLDCTPVLDVLDNIFLNSGGFSIVGGAGDFVRAGTPFYQALHSDIGPAKIPRVHRVADPPPLVVVNFAVEPVTHVNGPMRIIPRKRNLNWDFAPCFADESPEMRSSRVFPLQAGDAIIRDARVWHGGTPNLSDRTRFLPNLEVASASFTDVLLARHELWPVLPHEICETLSPRCRKYCPDAILAASTADCEGFRPNKPALRESWTERF